MCVCIHIHMCVYIYSRRAVRGWRAEAGDSLRVALCNLHLSPHPGNHVLCALRHVTPMWQVVAKAHILVYH